MKQYDVAKTINLPEAKKAVNVMMNIMIATFDRFSCNPTAITKNQCGYYDVAIFINGNRESASLYRNGSEFICIADIYAGEKTTFTGSQGNDYTFNDNGYLVAAE